MSCLDTANDCWIASNLREALQYLKSEKQNAWRTDCREESASVRIFHAKALTRSSTDHLLRIYLQTTTKESRRIDKGEADCIWMEPAAPTDTLGVKVAPYWRTPQVHGRWIRNEMSDWLIDLYARHSGFPPPQTHHFNWSHNDSPRCNSRISCSISTFYAAHLQGASESLPPACTIFPFFTALRIVFLIAWTATVCWKMTSHGDGEKGLKHGIQPYTVEFEHKFTRNTINILHTLSMYTTNINLAIYTGIYLYSKNNGMIKKQRQFHWLRFHFNRVRFSQPWLVIVDRFDASWTIIGKSTIFLYFWPNSVHWKSALCDVTKRCEEDCASSVFLHSLNTHTGGSAVEHMLSAESGSRSVQLDLWAPCHRQQRGGTAALSHFPLTGLFKAPDC